MTNRTARGTFAKGNPGRPKGTRAKATLAAEKLMDGEAETLTRTCINMAKAGDAVALRLCMERIAPVRKGRPVPFDLPKVEGVADVPKAGAAILQAVAKGRLSPEEAGAIMNVVEGFRKSVETNEILERLAVLEEATRAK
ncbi:DUF5681 domain-containing protein [Jiella sonneratiae]|uniref:DUF5681 domain-containing protein n=1 Tax=Jiella sonneratiae TaxID=2816856 RepID=A0ABS3J2C5_9HYPH|nr:DUF5681 domain-containing protein [Jiella sonneratiae]MBO0903810.1 hypothetical protein [Jiella sonneratiae]